MRGLNPAKSSRKVFYGWWIVFGSSVVTVLHGAFYFYGFSVFFPPLVTEFGSSRTALAGAFSLARLEGGLVGPVEGFLVDKFGPRKLMMIGVGLFGLGFILVSQAHSLLLFYIFFMPLALGASLASMLPAIAAISNWFVRRRSLAMSIWMTGLSVGGTFAFLVASLITRLGWRTTAIILGLAIWAIGFPMAALVRHHPEDYGLLPDGDTKERQQSDVQRPEVRPSLRPTAAADSFTPVQAMRTSAFWLLALSHSVSLLIVTAVATHLVQYLVDVGIEYQVAALFMSLLTAVSIVGRLVYGWLGDRVDKRYLLAIIYGIQCVALLVFANLQFIWQVVVFIVLYAPAYGGRGSLLQALRADYFGPRSIATIQGITGLVTMLGTILGPIFAAWVFDMRGSYGLAFLVMAFTNLAALGLILAVRRPVLPTRSADAVPVP